MIGEIFLAGADHCCDIASASNWITLEGVVGGRGVAQFIWIVPLISPHAPNVP
jgi:hypothetical protein